MGIRHQATLGAPLGSSDSGWQEGQIPEAAQEEARQTEEEELMARRRSYKRDKNGRFASTGGGGRSSGRRRGGSGGGGKALAVRPKSAAAIRRTAVATRSPGNVAIKGGSQPALRVPKGRKPSGKEIGIAIAFGAAGYGAYKLNQKRKARKKAKR
jgi:hypothetical protein